MIYTKQEEIILVRQNLEIFENRIPQKLIDLLLSKQIRIEQHGLFFSLCDDSIYPFLLEALKNIKKYNINKYFPKAVSKLTNNYEWFPQRTAIAEIIVVGYYFKKYLNNDSFNIEWERKVTETGKSVDVSILDKEKNKYLNIEVTGKMEDERIRTHFDLRYKTKLEIEKRIEKFSDQKYNYIFSILNKRKQGSEKLFEKHINDFIDFIAEVREAGIGKYTFIVDGKKLATVEINKLNRLDREYAAFHKDSWFGWMKDYKRLRHVIINKAKKQLPSDEINFVYIPNLSKFDDIVFQEAFLGKEICHVNLENGDTELSRKADGVVSILKDKNYSPIYGLIYSKLDYAKKNLLINPLIKCEEWIIDTIK